jgi:hypothetical protein
MYSSFPGRRNPNWRAYASLGRRSAARGRKISELLRHESCQCSGMKKPVVPHRLYDVVQDFPDTVKGWKGRAYGGNFSRTPSVQLTVTSATSRDSAPNRCRIGSLLASQFQMLAHAGQIPLTRASMPGRIPLCEKGGHMTQITFPGMERACGSSSLGMKPARQ